MKSDRTGTGVYNMDCFDENHNPAETIKIKYHYDDSPKLEQVEGSDWIDLYTAEETYIKSGEMKLIPLGVSMKLPAGYEAHVIPRSSTYKKWGVIEANSMGLIDESYCGDGDQWHFPALAIRPTHIPKGTRICQFRIMRKQPTIFFSEVDALGEKDRGGFGSTGD